MLCFQVYLASSAPPVRYPNVYGVDMPNRKEFVAHGLTEDQVRSHSCISRAAWVSRGRTRMQQLSGICCSCMCMVKHVPSLTAYASSQVRKKQFRSDMIRRCSRASPVIVRVLISWCCCAFCCADL